MQSQNNSLEELNSMEKKGAMNDKRDSLNEFYRVRAQLYRKHRSRMLTRFYSGFIVESGLLIFPLSMWANQLWLDKVWLSSAAGILVSLIWYILGAQDRDDFESIRKQNQYLEKRMAVELGIEDIRMRILASGNEVTVKLAAFPIYFLIIWIIVLIMTLVDLR